MIHHPGPMRNFAFAERNNAHRAENAVVDVTSLGLRGFPIYRRPRGFSRGPHSFPNDYLAVCVSFFLVLLWCILHSNGSHQFVFRSSMSCSLISSLPFPPVSPYGFMTEVHREVVAHQTHHTWQQLLWLCPRTFNITFMCRLAHFARKTLHSFEREELGP